MIFFWNSPAVMRGNFFISAGALSRPEARPAGGSFPPCPPRERARREVTTERKNNKSRTRAEQEQNKSRTRAEQPPARGAGAPHARAHSRSPHRPPGGSPTLHPITAGLVAPHARAPSRRSPYPRGWSRPMRAPPPAPTAAPEGAPPPFRPNILCRESARQSPPRFLFPRGGGEPPPRGARQNHISRTENIFPMMQKTISHLCSGARSRAPPARCSPSPNARFLAGARGARRRAPPPLGAGEPFIPSPCSHNCARLLLPLLGVVCPRPAVCPRRVGREVGLGA